MTPQSGDTLGGYRLIRIIGEGGMGVVWEAEQTGLGRRVALKIVRPSLASEPEFRSRFETEARSAASLDHPNVVTVYDSGEIEGHLFMSMALVDGPSLRELIDAEGNLSPARAAGIAVDVAAGLGAAHASGLVHRDVKPSNILLSLSQGKAVIADFGIAKVRDATRATSTGQVLGTLNYMAPEQMQVGTVDERADIYSLGAVLYEMLAGTPPYARETAPATMFAHVSDPIPKASATNPEVAHSLDDVVTSAMAKMPDARYSTMADFASGATSALGEDATTVMAAAPVVDDRTKVLYEQLNQTRLDTRQSGPPAPSGRAKSAGDAAAVAGAEPPKRKVTPKRILLVALALALGALFGGGVAVGLPKIVRALGSTTTSTSTTTTTSVSVSTTPPSTRVVTTANPAQAGGDASLIAGNWFGTAVQTRPSGHQDDVHVNSVYLRTDGNGDISGTWAEDDGSGNCSGRVTTRAQAGLTWTLDYRKTIEGHNCARSSTIELTWTSNGEASFNETYYTTEGNGHLAGKIYAGD